MHISLRALDCVHTLLCNLFPPRSSSCFPPFCQASFYFRHSATQYAKNNGAAKILASGHRKILSYFHSYSSSSIVYSPNPEMPGSESVDEDPRYRGLTGVVRDLTWLDCPLMQNWRSPAAELLVVPSRHERDGTHFRIFTFTRLPQA